jgi:uncharacterized protein YndB with AHSA1/START domain
VETKVRAAADVVWHAWTTPEHICQWNVASDDWHTPHATVDLRVGGQFTSRMEAKDKSMGFDFTGTYSEVAPPHRLAYSMADGREVLVEFLPVGDTVMVRETFDAESSHSVEQQQAGWQAILNRFAAYVQQLAKRE